MGATSSGLGVSTVGRYALYGEIASGGMATVHFGRLLGVGGFTRSVAIKRLHPQFAKDPEFVAMFLDEARLAARIAHPNVVPTLDVIAQGDELLLVMEYVRGASLSRLLRASAQRGERVPLRVAASILSGTLHGLHAAHEAKGESGEPLDIVHRDVSPQNVLVGTDGIARVLDFGVAKAAGRWHSTRQGQLKGKIAYMAPEQISTGAVTRKTDLYAAAVVFWEVLTGKRLFQAENEGKLLAMVIEAQVLPPSSLVPGLPPDFDRLVLRGLEKDADHRFATAREMAAEVESVVGTASAAEVGAWVEHVAAEELRERARRIEEIERSIPSPPISSAPSPPSAPSVPSVPGAVSSTKALALADLQTHRQGGRKMSLGVAAGGVAVVTVGLILLIEGGFGSRKASDHRFSPEAAVAVSTAPFPRPVPNESPRPPGPAPEPEALPSAPSAVSPGSSAQAAPAAQGRATTAQPPPTRSGRSPAAPKPPTPPPRPDCTPPYATDSKGHIHFKPACVN